MAQEPQRSDLTASSATIPSDSENYSSSPNELSPSPPSSSSSPMILYSPPTLWGLLRGAAINILLPFVNGLMLGFGELLAHEAAFRLGWSGTKVRTLSISLGSSTSDGWYQKQNLYFPAVFRLASLMLTIDSIRFSPADEVRDQQDQASSYKKSHLRGCGGSPIWTT